MAGAILRPVVDPPTCLLNLLVGQRKALNVLPRRLNQSGANLLQSQAFTPKNKQSSTPNAHLMNG